MQIGETFLRDCLFGKKRSTVVCRENIRLFFLSFADVKQTNYKDAIQKIKNCIVEAYRNFPQLITWDGFSEGERRQIMAVTSEMDDVTAQECI